MKLPFWPIPLVILAVVAGLQLYPQTGIFLMLFGAAYWSVYLINAALLLIVFDVWRGRAPRWLLAVPILVYGGSFIASGIGYIELRQLDRQLVAANRANATPFDPSRLSLVASDDGTARNLTSRFRLPVAYVANRNVAPFSYLAHRLIPQEQCSQIKVDIAHGVYRFGVSLDNRLIADACDLSAPEDPVHPTIVLSSDLTEQPGFLLGTRLWVTHIVTPAGHTAEIATGSGTIPSPIPRPVIGCTLIDSPSEWRCFAMLAPLRLPLAVESGPYGVAYGALAHALGLTPRTIVKSGRRYSFAPAEFAATGDGKAITKRIEQGVYTDNAHDFAVLERLIADPTQPVNGLEEGLLADEGRLVTYAGAMVDGLARAIAADDNGRTARQVLGDTIAALPDDAFAAIGEKLLATLRGHPFTEAPILYIRLGDLGPAAIPVLMEVLDQKYGSHAPAALGLCRVGAPAAAIAHQRLRALLLPIHDTISPTGTVRAALSLALLRLGFRDDVIADTAFYRSGKGWANYTGKTRVPNEPWYDEKIASVSPTSPPSVCQPVARWADTPAARRLLD